MSKSRGAFHPRPIDRAIFAILGLSHVLGGLYLAGPWYLAANTPVTNISLYSVFQNVSAVNAFGIVFFINGLALMYSTFGSGKKRYYYNITTIALLTGFLIRLYALIGSFLVLESWRPPTYLSNTVIVCLFGTMWIWVRIHERTTK